MTRSYPLDRFDGVPRAPKVVSADETIAGEHEGSVYVQPGATLTLTGTLKGTLTVESGASAEIQGRHPGTLHIAPGAYVSVTGRQAGSTHNDGLFVVESSGAQRGTLHNTGTVKLRGELAGALHDSGNLETSPSARIVAPTRAEGDVTVWVHRD